MFINEREATLVLLQKWNLETFNLFSIFCVRYYGISSVVIWFVLYFLLINRQNRATLQSPYKKVNKLHQHSSAALFTVSYPLVHNWYFFTIEDVTPSRIRIHDRQIKTFLRISLLGKSPIAYKRATQSQKESTRQ